MASFFERSVEPPTVDEGFSTVEARPFVRRQSGGSTRAILLDYDDLVARDSGAMLERYSRDGWLLFAHAWRPDVAGRTTVAALLDEFARTRERLGLSIEITHCPHEAGPPVCWCRKPLPGSFLEFALRHHVALDRSILVGHSAADRTLAQRIGVPYEPAERFFDA